MKTIISSQIMDRVWLLHKKGLKNAEIGELLSISKASVIRIVVMSLAEKGDIETLSNYSGKGCYSTQKQYAKKYFGIVEQPKPESKPVLVPHDNTAVAMTKIIAALEKQLELLEMLCTALGVNKEVNKQ